MLSQSLTHCVNEPEAVPLLTTKVERQENTLLVKCTNFLPFYDYVIFFPIFIRLLNTGNKYYATCSKSWSFTFTGSFNPNRLKLDPR